ncbi:MAG: ADP-ribosylglycohydrolase family protein [Gemmatimonadota bacterium]|nr:ADP-ribosylglycohydrolase family protein [Gemmatimonadota bacterium]
MAETRVDIAASLDRARGALVGLALGDALGTTLEFASRDSKPRVTDLVGGGPFGLAAGEWTDDTSMALCLAESLLERGGLDVHDLMVRFLRWREEGHNSVTGVCFDIGNATDAALRSFRATGKPLSGSTDPRSAGNGSLMRLSPVAIRWWHDHAKATAAARLQSRTTHGAAQAVEACALFVELLIEAIAGAPKETVMRARDWTGDRLVADVAAGSWRAKERDDISSSGYVVHTLEAALWCVDRSASVEDALILAANLAGDADTVAAVTGQLAGALWGMSGAPAGWLDKLAWRDRLEALAAGLFEAAAGERTGAAGEAPTLYQ